MILNQEQPDVIRKRTSTLFAKIFPLTTSDDFERFRGLTSPNALGVARGSIRNKRVLDLGCGGMGSTIASFLEQGARRVVGIDLSRKNIRALRRKFKGNRHLTLLQGDICSLPEHIGYFDIIVSYGVIHHTIAPEMAVRGAYKVCKPGGMIVVYLYGSGGILSWIIGRFRVIQKRVPLEKFIDFTRRRLPAVSFYLGDYWYVPMQHHYTWQSASALFRQEGFRHIERLPNTPVMNGWIKYFFPSQVDYRSLWSRVLFGCGGITLKARKPMSHSRE